MKIAVKIILLFTSVLCALNARAQENEQICIQGKRYLDLNIHALDRYAKRQERTQEQLLNRLKRKEQRLAAKLLRTDSAAYARLKSQPLSFDSISKLARHPDSATLAAKAVRSGHKAIDTLKGVYRFLQQKAGAAGNGAGSMPVGGLDGYTGELKQVQEKLAYNQYITDLTSQHSAGLAAVTGGNNQITGIQKELYYAKSKIAAWKKVAEEPSALEEKALEYLQGSKGFDQTLTGALNGGGGKSSTSAGSVDDLEKMGFQTKRQLNAQLQEKFGSKQLEGIQGNMGKEVQQWQDKAQDLQQQFKETKSAMKGLKQTGKPDFKVNPMRGLPFRQRLQKQYGFSTARAATQTDGTGRPAILTLSAGVAYRQTPKLSIGMAVAGDAGLGQSWSSIRLSFEGIGARVFLTQEVQYGIGIYGGYERTWKAYAFKTGNESAAAVPSATVHSKAGYNESVLLGLTKKYKINSKWNGSVQLLWDFWWQEKGLRSPLVLRFINIQ